MKSQSSIISSLLFKHNFSNKKCLQKKKADKKIQKKFTLKLWPQHWEVSEGCKSFTVDIKFYTEAQVFEICSKFHREIATKIMSLK